MLAAIIRTHRPTRSAALSYLLLLACAVCGFAGAAESPAEPPQATEVSAAPVIVDGVELFLVSGSASLNSERRARDVTARIVSVASEPSLSPNDLRLQSNGDHIDVMARERHLVTVIHSDAALEEAPVAAVAKYRLDRIREAIERYRQERTSERLIRAGLMTSVIAVICGLGIWLTVQLARLISRWLDRRFHARVQSLRIRSYEVVRAESIWRTIERSVSAMRTVAVIAICYAGVATSLRLFPWTRSSGNRLVDFVVQPAQTIGVAIVEYIPKLIFLVILFAIVRYLLKVMNLFARAVSAGAVTLSGFDAEWAQPTYNIVRALIVLLAIVVAYPYLPGSGSAAFQGLSIFAGLMLSLGASSAMASIIAGYTVTYRRAYHVGDRITVGEYTGEVTQIRLMVTHLRTPKNEEIIVPNSVVLQNQVVNYSTHAKEVGLILHTTVGIGYETPWRQVEAMLVMAAQRTPGVSTEPRPFVLEKALGDFAVTYELNTYVDNAQDMAQRYAALHRNILDVFNEHGVQIMTPAYEGDPEQPKIVPKELWYTSPALEAGVTPALGADDRHTPPSRATA